MAKTADEYVSNSPWAEELNTLRGILNQTELKEEVKWGTPHYTLGGKIVVGIAGFKSYFGLWFHQGVFLSDPKKVLVNAQEGTTKALRQWRFHDASDIDESSVLQYVKEAIANQKAGKEIKPEPKKVPMPDELKEALASDGVLAEAYAALTAGKQKEYAAHIGEAKQQKTRENRLAKCIPMIKEGVGLYDKYK